MNILIIFIGAALIGTCFEKTCLISHVVWFACVVVKMFFDLFFGKGHDLFLDLAQIIVIANFLKDYSKDTYDENRLDNSSEHWE
jgi:hypothetical protein